GKANDDPTKVWYDANTVTGPILLGGHAAPEFEYIVTNTGNVALSGVVVTDDKLGAIGTVDLAANGGTTTLYVAGTWAAGQNTNTGDANWSFTDSAGNQASGDPNDPANYFGATTGLTIVKMVSVDGKANDDPTKVWYDANTVTGPILLGGHAAPEFEYIVTNTGNVALSGVVVTDDKLGALGNVALARN